VTGRPVRALGAAAAVVAAATVGMVPAPAGAALGPTGTIATVVTGLVRPAGITVDPAGDLFVADSAAEVVRRLAPNGSLSTVAGDGAAGYSGDGGPATSASLADPVAVAVDGSGNLYIADSGSDRVRRVAPTGVITTFAGSGAYGTGGDGGPATSASFEGVAGLAVGGGFLYVTDYGADRVRRIDLSSDVIGPAAGSGVYGWSGDGGPAPAATLSGPTGLATDASGDLFIAETGDGRVRRVDGTTGIISTVAGGGQNAEGGDGGPATSASFDYPVGVAVDGAGDLFVAEAAGQRVRQIAVSGVVFTVAGTGVAGLAGDGGPSRSALLRDPEAVATDPAGGVEVADAGNHRVRRMVPVAPGGCSGVLPDGGVRGLAATPDGGGYWVAATDGEVSAAGDAACHGSQLGGPISGPVVAVAATPDGGGYWLADADGGVFAFGDAAFRGSMGGTPLAAPVVGLAATPDGGGYWLVASDGGVFAFGDAGFFGSAGAIKLNRPIVAMAATPDGRGYWLVASDGGVFTYGDAPFLGSMGVAPLRSPVVSLAADPATGGYWMAASDGGVFSFGAPFLGSAADMALSRPVVGMAATPDGRGYWLVASDGGVFTYGDARFSGSPAG